ncbi:MAG TPA: Bcr/CflA family multidrug efflux MFS transporter [Tepidisphaeraceae bacterium]|jgi:DHA1 family bicyclomycin/chloramphenicol resistance-like MFS transporter|nr:Bcr/CflA family multidrug efflux MFS transporter [Tepidisphaeraceae bacterium]
MLDESHVRPSLPGRAVFWLTIYLGTLAALGPLAIDMYLPAFPRIAENFHVQIPDIQRTLASYFIGLAIGQLIYGPLADRFGRKRPLYFGLTLFALSSAGCALAWNVPSLTLIRFIQALGGCAEMVIARAIVRDLFNDQQSAKVFSSLLLVMGLAPILAPLLGGFLAVHLSWRAIFWFVTIAGVATLFSTAFFFHESLPADRRIRQSPKEILGTYAYLLRHRDFMLHAMTVSIGTAGLFAYVGGSPYVFEKIFHISESHFGLYFGPIACGIIGMSQVNGFLASRFDIRKILRSALFVHAGAGILLVIDSRTGIGGFWGIFIPLWLIIASMGFVFPNTTVLAMSPHGRIAGNASAVLGFLQFGVSAVISEIVVAIQNHQLIPTSLPMSATIAICSTSALCLNLLTHSAPTTPNRSEEAEGSILAAEY